MNQKVRVYEVSDFYVRVRAGRVIAEKSQKFPVIYRLRRELQDIGVFFYVLGESDIGEKILPASITAFAYGYHHVAPHAFWDQVLLRLSMWALEFESFLTVVTPVVGQRSDQIRPVVHHRQGTGRKKVILVTPSEEPDDLRRFLRIHGKNHGSLVFFDPYRDDVSMLLGDAT